MSIVARKITFWAAPCLALIVFGCGKSQTPAPDSTASAGPGLPTASIGHEQPPVADDADSEEDDHLRLSVPEEGTPEWLVHESTRLLLEPPPDTQDVEVLKAHRRERNERIIALAQQAIEAIQADGEKERVLTLAVHNLLEARLQSALAGDAEQLKLLYEDAGRFYDQAPESPAAAEGAQALVNLAYTSAKTASDDSAHWLGELARQARHFARDFPNEERRALPMLFTAARSCELGGLADEARECYELIQQAFPYTPFGSRAAPILRRLSLPGNQAQLAGPTLDGESFALDDLAGRVVVVVFWSTEARPFLEQLPALLKITRDFSERKVDVVGVNLDQDSSAVQAFILEHRVGWPQIFFPEPEKRGWNNPIAAYYGIMDIPALWLIDREGSVVSTNVKAESLAAEIEKLVDQKPEGEEPETPAEGGIR